MGRRVVLSIALLLLAATIGALAAGCSLWSSQTAEKLHTAGLPPSNAVRLGVVDGDLRTRVKGAVVRIGRIRARTNRKGWARIPLRHRGNLWVTVRKRGYDPISTRIEFRNHPRMGVEIFQTKLQWRLYGANPARTQAQTSIRVRPPFKVVWAKPAGGLIEFPAVVDHGVAFIGNQVGTIRAFSMKNGQLLWRRPTPGVELASSPAVDGQAVVIHGMDGHVYVRSRWNGRLLWRFDAGSAIESSPVVRNGVDYFGTWSGDIYALDLRTHDVRWIYRDGNKITSSASFGRGTMYIGDYGGRLLALSPATGRLRWTGGVNGRIYGTPAYSDGRIFVPSSDGASLTAFSARGARLWSVHTGAYVYSSPAVWGGRVFFGSYNGVLYGVSARSGAVLWHFGTGGAISGAVVVVDGIVYAGNFSHRIYGVSARSGRQLLAFPHGDYVPVSGNGGRLLLHGFSRLFAVEPKRRR
ncbi:MAG TPA: PQQ-binding-like beta-propeller repeat protein [Gaiellaceae bacterium]|nr:PQQ-binding-like beta-propeller repeat protein [Gaiellaceae bacterium]